MAPPLDLLNENASSPSAPTGTAKKRILDSSPLHTVREGKVSKRSPAPLPSTTSFASPLSKRSAVLGSRSATQILSKRSPTPNSTKKPATQKPSPKAKKTTPTHRTKKKAPSVAEGDEDEAFAISRAEKADLGIGFEVEQGVHASAGDPQYASWTEAEREVFNRFSAMGTVPLMPSTWQMEFPTMPDLLFSRKDNKTFINSLNGNQFQAMKALNALLGVGTRVRDRLIAQQDPSLTLQSAIDLYYNWAIRDGDLHERTFTPILAVARAAQREITGQAVARVTEEFQNTANDYRDWWWEGREKRRTPPPEDLPEKEEDMPYMYRPLPTLYGVVIKMSVVAVVTYDAEKDDGTVNNINVFDFADDGQDVWNGFAIAIVMCQIRNYLVSLNAPHVRGGKAPDPDV